MRSFVTFLLLLLTLGCTEAERSFNRWMEPNGKIKVLATTAMIADIVKQVGGERVDVITLIIGDLDPHSYQLVKGDDEKLVFAEMIFYNGLGLEHGASLKYALEQSAKAIAVGNWIIENDPSVALYVNGNVDPHIWMDVSLWAKTVVPIVSTLSEHDPDNREMYEANGRRVQGKMEAAHRGFLAELQRVPSKSRYLVTSHDSFSYFTKVYLAEKGETEVQWAHRFASPEGLAPDSQLSIHDIRAIIDHLKQFEISVIFPECNVNQDSLQKIVEAGRHEGIDVTIASECLYADSMPHQQSYLDMLKYNVALMQTYWIKS